MPANLLALSAAQIDLFINDGFVRIDNAFPRDVAAAARAILWADTGCDPANPATWTRPLMAQPPLMPSTPLQLERPDGTYSPVETAICRALGHS